MRAAAPELRRRKASGFWSATAAVALRRGWEGVGGSLSLPAAESSKEVPGAKLPSSDERRRRPGVFVAERSRINCCRCCPRVERALSSDKGRKLLTPEPERRDDEGVDMVVLVWKEGGMATEKSRIHGQKAKDAEDAASKPQQRSAEMRRFHALVRARFAACPLVRVVKLKILRVSTWGELHLLGFIISGYRSLSDQTQSW